jgi:acetylornithine deacetylase/succinyl-diaminopimelate desuccinylase-like protein
LSASRVVDDLLELAAIPAPTFAEESRIAWLERRLLDARGTRARDDVGNLLWTWGEGRPQLLLLAHVDTVFAADTPLSFERDGDRLVGPGIGDNAAAVALVAHVVADLLEREGLAPGAVAFTVGEEGIGNLRGAFAACSSLDPEAVIAVEGHGLDRVLVDAVGSVRACVRVTGPGGHSWEDRGRPSAIHVLLELGRELAALGTHDAPVNIGLLSGGQSVNTIAAEAQLAVELRALDPEAIDGFVRRLDTLDVVSRLTLDVELLGRRPAGRLPRESPLLAMVRRARTAVGLGDALGAGSTDANAALALGIPALTIGAACGGNMHTPTEWLDTSSLDLGRRQLEAVLLEMLGPA